MQREKKRDNNKETETWWYDTSKEDNKASYFSPIQPKKNLLFFLIFDFKKNNFIVAF